MLEKFESTVPEFKQERAFIERCPMQQPNVGKYSSGICMLSEPSIRFLIKNNIDADVHYMK